MGLVWLRAHPSLSEKGRGARSENALACEDLACARPPAPAAQRPEPVTYVWGWMGGDGLVCVSGDSVGQRNERGRARTPSSFCGLGELSGVSFPRRARR